jgi:uncharacterized membrane protein
MDEFGAGVDGALLFEAVIVPHRSLSPRGLRLLLGVIAGLCILVGLRFWLAGAWPVIGFSGLEVGLAAVLLWQNATQARASELVLLSERTVRIVRTDPKGQREERTLPSGWLQVGLEETPGRVPRLVLSVRRQHEEIGQVLGEAPKRELAAALREALHKARNPRFDNPQLRAGELPLPLLEPGGGRAPSDRSHSGISPT